MISAVTTPSGEPEDFKGGIRCRLTIEDRACGFHLGQSIPMLTNRPVIVEQSDLPSTASVPLQEWESPYSPYSIVLRRAEMTVAPTRRWRPVRSNKGFGPVTATGEGVSGRLRMQSHA